jgi:hypothetical protein
MDYNSPIIFKDNKCLYCGSKCNNSLECCVVDIFLCSNCPGIAMFEVWKTTNEVSQIYLHSITTDKNYINKNYAIRIYPERKITINKIIIEYLPKWSLPPSSNYYYYYYKHTLKLMEIYKENIHLQLNKYWNINPLNSSEKLKILLTFI